MSLPPELRVLCLKLSNTPTSDLPRLTPTLVRYVSRCHVPLSSPAGNASKADTSASSVQVHTLKTQLSTLLNGKSPEGRFTAVVLIKAVVEVGGWEVLRGSEVWVRGLLSILGKPDSAAAKELCIVALTKIYCMTHQYQTLVREITTPTLPTFVTSCLNLISSKSSSKGPDIPTSLIEAVFMSFATLLPRHTTVYRPFVSQIRAVVKPYLAPTLSDGVFVPPSLSESARRLVVLLHQTVAKNAGGEEWGKAVRNLVKDIHVTADRIFRAVIEDWESSAGYVAEPVDVNEELSGGARNADDFPRWIGIDAGVQRMVGLHGMLEEYFKVETSMAVSIPLGVIIDMITRMLSIAIPSLSQLSTGKGGARLHPAIDRDERDGLWAGMTQIYVAALQVISRMAERLQEGFMPMAQGFFDQLAWVFPYGKHDSNFRSAAYKLTAQILSHIGQNLGKPQISRTSGIIRSCCQDIQPADPNLNNTGSNIEAGGKKSLANVSNSNQNADTFLQNTMGATQDVVLDDTDLIVSASELLPLFMSHIPQRHLDISLRSLVERTAILSHNKKGMLASILNPFVGKNGKAMTSVLPHLTREFHNHDIVEILLRPRMPLVPSTGTHLASEEGAGEEDADEDMEMHSDTLRIADGHPDTDSLGDASMIQSNLNEHGLQDSASPYPTAAPTSRSQPGFGNSMPSDQIKTPSTFNKTSDQPTFIRPPEATPRHSRKATETNVDVKMNEDIDSSDDESVHLTMQLDTDSDSDS